MPDMVNPYIAGNPVTGTEMFFGREDVFTFVRQALTGQHRDNVIVLYGQRRTGKTSVLYQMHRHLDPRYLCIFVDLHGLALEGLNGFLWELANTMARSLRKDHQIDLPRPKNQAEFMADARNSFENDFLPQVWSAIGDRHVLLMLDEAIRLQEQIQAGKLEKEVFEYLRHLMQHHEHLNFLFSLGSGLEEMEKEYAFLFSVGLYKRISLLEREAALALITQPVKDCYQVEPAAIERIMSITSGQAYYTQLVCHSLFNRWQQDQQSLVTVKDVDAILDEVVERGLAVLKHVWEESQPGEKAVLAGLAAAMGDRNRPIGPPEISRAWEQLNVALPENERAKAIKSLIARDVILGHDQYRFAIDLQRLWVAKYERLEWVKEEIAGDVERWRPVQHEPVRQTDRLPRRGIGILVAVAVIILVVIILLIRTLTDENAQLRNFYAAAEAAQAAKATAAVIEAQQRNATATAEAEVRTRPTAEAVQQDTGSISDLIGLMRTQAGLPSYQPNEQLNHAAILHSLDMARYAQVSDIGPDGSTVQQRVSGAGYSGSESAEIIYGGRPNAVDAVKYWSNDIVSLARLLSTRYRDIGVGAAQGISDTFYAVVLGAPEVTGLSTPAGPQSGASKLGLFISAGNRSGFGEFLQKITDAGKHLAVITTIDQDIGADLLHFGQDQTLVVGRTQRDSTGKEIGDCLDPRGADGTYVLDPQQAAQSYFDLVKPIWKANPYVDVWQPFNECDGFWDWQSDFYIALMQLAERDGFHLALYASTAGNPRDVAAARQMIPALQYAKQRGHYLALHEYGFSFGTLRASAPYLALRYRSLYEAVLIPNNADPPLILTEVSPGAGGFGNLSRAEWLDDLRWYDSELMKDGYVVGAAVYQLGGAENIQAALPALGDYIAAPSAAITTSSPTPTLLPSPAPTVAPTRVDVATATTAAARVIYSNSGGRIDNRWSDSSTSTTPSGRSFHGPFSNAAIRVNLDNLPPHQEAILSFDLFIINSWDGSGEGGPDSFKVIADGKTLLERTFSNVDGTPDRPRYQSYPDGTDNSARTGADPQIDLGYVCGETPKCNAVYHVNLPVSHVSDTLALMFESSVTSPEEYFGLDNVQVAVR